MNSLYDVCWMAVEPRYAAKVETLLRSLRGAGEVGPAQALDEDSAARTGGRRRSNDGGVLWSAEGYDAFMGADKESYRRIRAFGDVLATSPGQPISTTVASGAAGVTHTQLRAALGKFTTWIKAAPGNESWPFGWAYGEEVDPANAGEFHYSMSEDQAAAWKAARERMPEPVQ